MIRNTIPIGNFNCVGQCSCKVMNVRGGTGNERFTNELIELKLNELNA